MIGKMLPRRIVTARQLRTGLTVARQVAFSQQRALQAGSSEYPALVSNPSWTQQTGCWILIF
jgi:hypothetical protein